MFPSRSFGEASGSAARGGCCEPRGWVPTGSITALTVRCRIGCFALSSIAATCSLLPELPTRPQAPTGPPPIARVIIVAEHVSVLTEPLFRSPDLGEGGAICTPPGWQITRLGVSKEPENPQGPIFHCCLWVVVFFSNAQEPAIKPWKNTHTRKKPDEQVSARSCLWISPNQHGGE